MMDNYLWYKNAIFYEVYVRAFHDSNGDGHGDLPGLTQKLDYLQELGVDCLWLMPIYPSPLKDDGYDIADYYNILETYGTAQDFKTLLDEAHVRGMRVIADLVLNHTSDQHPWFQASRSDKSSPYRDYYVWSDTDQKYQDARIIFLDTERSNWTWDEQAKQYFWHRFYSSQPDLNYDSPAVRQEMLNVARHWLEMGIDGFRADAVPYLFEREGTNCENLPETHAYLKEFHIGFHFPVMPRIFMALRKEDKTPLVWIVDRTPPIPAECQWVIFLRNHDELTLEMVTEEERQWMWQEYAPEPRMRLNLGIRRRLAPLLDNDRRKIELANSLLLTSPGSPIIYYGDEIGMGDDIYLPDRNGVRTPMQWNNELNAGFSTAPADALYAPMIQVEPYGAQWVNVADQRVDPNSLWHRLRRMISVRKAHPAFGWGDFSWAETGSLAVAAYWRVYGDEQLLILNNLSQQVQSLTIDLAPGKEIKFSDILTGNETLLTINGKLELTLKPFEYRWLKRSN